MGRQSHLCPIPFRAELHCPLLVQSNFHTWLHFVHTSIRAHLAIHNPVDILPSFISMHFVIVSLNGILTSHLVVSNGDQYLGGLFLLIVACARWVGNFRDITSGPQNPERIGSDLDHRIWQWHPTDSWAPHWQTLLTPNSKSEELPNPHISVELNLFLMSIVGS